MYFCDQSNLNHNIYITPGELHCRPSKMNALLQPLPQHLHCLYPLPNCHKIPSRKGGILSHEIRLSLCDAGWMNARFNCSYISALYTKEKTMQLKGRNSWEPDLHFSEDTLLSCRKRVQHDLFLLVMGKKFASHKSCGQNTTQQMKIKILVLI